MGVLNAELLCGRPEQTHGPEGLQRLAAVGIRRMRILNELAQKTIRASLTGVSLARSR